MSLLHVVAGMTAGFLLAAGGTAPPSIGGGAHDHVIDLTGQDSDPGKGPSSGSGAWPRLITTYIPACGGNLPGVSAVESTLCQAAIQMCSDTAEPTDVMSWRYTALREADGTTTPWQAAGGVCLRPQDVPTGAVPAFTAADFRRLPLPASTLHVQPATGRTLVAVPTNLYAAAGPQTFDVTLLGLPVRVRATPTAWTWTYGDGTTATRTVPGGPYPDLSTAHTYIRPGRYPVTVTTTWSGTYSVAGGPALPVDGTATVTTPPVTLTAVATRAELVADPVN